MTPEGNELPAAIAYVTEPSPVAERLTLNAFASYGDPTEPEDVDQTGAFEYDMPGTEIGVHHRN